MTSKSRPRVINKKAKQPVSVFEFPSRNAWDEARHVFENAESALGRGKTDQAIGMYLSLQSILEDIKVLELEPSDSSEAYEFYMKLLACGIVNYMFEITPELITKLLGRIPIDQDLRDIAASPYAPDAYKEACIHWLELRKAHNIISISRDQFNRAYRRADSKIYGLQGPSALETLWGYMEEEGSLEDE